MDYFEKRGIDIRMQAKNLVLEYMHSTPCCAPDGSGMKQSDIFRACGFDWGYYENATSSNQQDWIVALLRELEAENEVQRNPSSKLWRLV